jgi:hypothetical protein
MCLLIPSRCTPLQGLEEREEGRGRGRNGSRVWVGRVRRELKRNEVDEEKARERKEEGEESC